ncbi:nuclease SNase domain protein [Halorhabdus tiamatea SARL4B]|uniref:Nuclease (SNase domain protein) n=1 Tax=Halorhabdus tiamatea SARL4B TaxID=1033806 RepID=F7PK05_9EURY|nr:thermonuclease family protein [Halorhabdus tiamatea]ERJ07534.1 nuclease SNase domain protein [Halorhabdus tiamatea SARL4B]CCQ33518.1 nuclease (SNase domain protein) [Halorhabdus tiamatea SARL4B]
MRGRDVVVIAVLLLAGCTGLPGGQPDAGTATSPGSGGTAVEISAAETPAAPAGENWTVTVVEVIDGDTMDVRFENGSTERIRLLGVDTPEPDAEVNPAEWDGIPDTEAGLSWLRDWAENAGVFAEQRLAGEEVRIVTDELAGRRGGYGRLLVYVVLDGDVFGQQLLEGGYARLYETEFGLYDRFATAEGNAQAADRGVWGFEKSA